MKLIKIVALAVMGLNVSLILGAPSQRQTSARLLGKARVKQQAKSHASLIVTDIDGKRHNILNSKKATVLVFTGHECPISNAYAPEVNRISATYAAQGMAFYLVYAEPGLSRATVRTHAHDYSYRFPVLLDPGHRLVKKAGVTITPEVAVLSPGGKVLYRGRIDDRFITYGRMRPQPTSRDLRRALDAVLQQTPVSPAVTKAIGCFIPTVS